MPTPFKCPVCDGSGLVSRPPWIAGDVYTWPSSSGLAPYNCTACTGTGVIWRYEFVLKVPEFQIVEDDGHTTE